MELKKYLSQDIGPILKTMMSGIW